MSKANTSSVEQEKIQENIQARALLNSRVREEKRSGDSEKKVRHEELNVTEDDWDYSACNF